MPHELIKDFQFQESDKEIIKSEIKQLEVILEESNISNMDLNTLKAQYASFMNLPKEQFEDELAHPSGMIDFMQVDTKEKLVDLMKKDLENLHNQDEKNSSLQN